MSPILNGTNHPDLAAKQAKTAHRKRQDQEYARLQSEWRQLFRSPAPKRLSRDMLRLGISWKKQTRTHGGHSRMVTKQLSMIADDLNQGKDIAPPDVSALKVGSRLVREWNGQTHDVIVVEGGFRWRGEIWPSLSAIAREITGTRWSGPRFFGIAGTRKRGAINPALGSKPLTEERS